MSVQIDVITYEIELDILTSGEVFVNLVDGLTVYDNGSKVSTTRALDIRGATITKDGNRIRIVIDSGADTLQEAYDNGDDGVIIVEEGKPFQVSHENSLLSLEDTVSLLSNLGMAIQALGGNLGIGATGNLSISSSVSGGNKTLTLIGSNFFSLTNPSAVTWPRLNADNSISALSAEDTIHAIHGIRIYYKSLTPYTVNNTTSNTIINEGGAGLLIPANTFQAGDIIRIRCSFTTNGLGGGSVHASSISFNTSATLVGATVLAIYNAASLATNYYPISRQMLMVASNSQQIFPNSVSSPSDLIESTAGTNVITVDFAVNQYLLVAVDPNAVAHAITLRSIIIEILR